MKKILLLLAIPLCAQEPLGLSMKKAVELAIAPDGNARLQLGRELTQAALARKNIAKAALLPNVDAAITETDFSRNLKAFGFNIPIPVPGYVSPTVVGPLSNIDMRAAFSQSVLDFSAWKRLDAAKAGLQIAEAEKESTSNQVADAVAKAYLSALRTKATVDATRANVQLAQRLEKLASDQKEAGTGTGIEVVRAQVQLANEQQRLKIDELRHEESKLYLTRAIGIDFNVVYSLTDELTLAPSNLISVEEAMASAKIYRADWIAQQRRANYANLNYQAVRAERMPSIGVFGDYGGIGISPGGMAATHTVGATVKIPVFDGGRRDARRAEQVSAKRQEEIKAKDFGRQVELDIRLARGEVIGAEGQVAVAELGLKLSQQEVEQAERRYRAGVAPSIELVDAKTRFARAQDNRILALYQYNLARVDLATAMGALHRILQ